jgi:hypothetical protein
MYIWKVCRQKCCGHNIQHIDIRHTDIQHTDIWHNGVCHTQHDWHLAKMTLNITALSWVSLCSVPCLIYCYAECHYAVCRYAECHYAECHYAECQYADSRGIILRHHCSFLSCLGHLRRRDTDRMCHAAKEDDMTLQYSWHLHTNFANVSELLYSGQTRGKLAGLG